MPLAVACVQFSPGNDMDSNLEMARILIVDAVSQGAELIALPEFAAFLDRNGHAMSRAARDESGHAALIHFEKLARQLNVWIMVGSLVVRDDANSGCLFNRSYAITPKGQVAARYNKIHMFDAMLPNGGSVRESKAYCPGSHAVIVHLSQAAVGLSICYDLRFPSLYLKLARNGAEIIMVPSAFSYETGQAHWLPLLQARAIENGCFVIAAATCGTHPGGWRTWGHSVIIDPWGKIIEQAKDKPGLVTATLDLEAVRHARQMIPSLSNQRKFDILHEYPSKPIT